jgi:hypothetical protein
MAWDDRYERRYGYWRPYIMDVIYRYLDCGDLHFGFARVKCAESGHEYYAGLFLQTPAHFAHLWIHRKGATSAWKGEAGIVYDRWHPIRRGKDKGLPDLGEAPQAYKDIDRVIASELDLIQPEVKLTPRPW